MELQHKLSKKTKRKKSGKRSGHKQWVRERMEEDREREELRLMSSHHRSHVRVEDWVPWPYTHNKVELPLQHFWMCLGESVLDD